MNNNLEIYFPIIKDFKFEKYCFKQRDLIIDELANILKEKIFITDGYIIDYKIKIEIEKYRKNLLKPNIEEFEKMTTSENLNLTINITSILDKFEYDESQSEQEIENEIPIQKKENVLAFEIIEFFSKKIFEILTLSQIARPGSLKIRDGYCFFDNVLIKNKVSSPKNYREALEYRDNLKYPKISFLNFVDLYKWLEKINPIFDSKPNNCFQRTLNNITYINTEKNEISEFIYQLRILEDLYTSSNVSVTEQLNQKIQLFLGEMTEFKKEIKKMYAIRSDFIHGRMNIEASHKLSELEYDDYLKTDESPISNASNFSLSLVLATLQGMYKAGIFDLVFELKLKIN